MVLVLHAMGLELTKVAVPVGIRGGKDVIAVMVPGMMDMIIPVVKNVILKGR
jgi:hypothetical protein